MASNSPNVQNDKQNTNRSLSSPPHRYGNVAVAAHTHHFNSWKKPLHWSQRPSRYDHLNFVNNTMKRAKQLRIPCGIPDFQQGTYYSYPTLKRIFNLTSYGEAAFSCN
jgi:hypothetical protein